MKSIVFNDLPGIPKFSDLTVYVSPYYNERELMKKAGEDMKTIAFDFDGTLIDSMGMWRNLSKNYLESNGIVFSEKIAQRLTAMSLTMAANFFREELGINKTVEEITAEIGETILYQYTHTLKLKPGAVQVLEELSKKHIPLSLATATNEEFVLPALEHKGLTDYFNFIQTCDNSGYRKSNPKFYNVLAERSRVRPEELLLVDDAVYALNAAKDAGAQTLAVYDRYSDESWQTGEYRGHSCIRNLGLLMEKVSDRL